MDANQNNNDNHVQNHHNQEPVFQFPPLLRDLPGLEELRAAMEELEDVAAALEELQREEMAAALEAQAQHGAPVASVTNGFPPPPPHHAAERAANHGQHSAQATSTDNGHPPPPQNRAAEGGPVSDIGSDSSDDDDDVSVESFDD